MTARPHSSGDTEVMRNNEPYWSGLILYYMNSNGTPLNKHWSCKEARDSPVAQEKKNTGSQNRGQVPLRGCDIYCANLLAGDVVLSMCTERA